MLSYESYKGILEIHAHKVALEKIKIFRNMQIFNDWPDSALQIIYNIWQTVEFQVGSYVFRENSESTYIYFIQEGEVELSASIHENNNCTDDNDN